MFIPSECCWKYFLLKHRSHERALPIGLSQLSRRHPELPEFILCDSECLVLGPGSQPRGGDLSLCVLAPHHLLQGGHRKREGKGN